MKPKLRRRLRRLERRTARLERLVIVCTERLRALAPEETVAVEPSTEWQMQDDGDAESFP